jgi:hypothetical protein
MLVDWDSIYKSRGLFSGHGSRGKCAEIKRIAIQQTISEYDVKSILDVGCGDQYVMKQVTLDGIDYLGLDASRQAVEQLGEQHGTLRVCCEDFLESTRLWSADLVLCLDVLIHLDDPIEYRRFTERLKRSAGKVILISGFTRSKPEIDRSNILHFHESVYETFQEYNCKTLGEYRHTTLLLVDLEQRRDRRHTIWSYWETAEDQRRPAYLDLCEETWHRHCGDDFEIVRVTPENVHEYAPDLIPQWHKIPCLAHKADYLRAVLVHRHGGIWLDSDIIVLRNLREMMERLEESGSDFIGCGRPGKRPSNGIFGGKAGCDLLEQYIQSMNEFIKGRGDDLQFKWTELGYHLLWPLSANYHYFQYDFRVCIPVHPSRFRRFFDRCRLEELNSDDCDLRADTLAVYLYNAMFPLWFKKLPKRTVLRSPMVISQFLRRALGIPHWQHFGDADEIFDEMKKLQHRKKIPHLLRRLGLNRRICEIGVRTGRHLDTLVRGSVPSEFVAIDPWIDDDVPSRNDAGYSQSQLDKLEAEVRTKFEKFGDCGKIIRGYSFEVADQFPDEYFDYVYIDADHSYEAVKQDLADWYPKVRKGGILAGHDYVERKLSRVRFGVRKAVDEFVKQHNVEYFSTTPEHLASWLILKERVPATPKFCYWSIGFGKENQHAMLRGLVKSARAAGVQEDFHVFTNPGVEVTGAEVHRFDRSLHFAPAYMFKLEVLKSLKDLDYDYLVFLDADNYFTRKPTQRSTRKILRLADPLHASLTAQLNSDSISAETRHKARWWGMRLAEIIDIWHEKGCEAKSVYSLNAGFFIVKRDEWRKVYDTCWEIFRELKEVRGFDRVTDEIALSFAMTKLTNPEGHCLKHKWVNDFWCTDRGNYRGVLPEGNPFPFWTNWNCSRFEVNPAIVHAMKSKKKLIEYGKESLIVDSAS